MTVNIKIWGPSLWELIHVISHGYDINKNKKYYINFFNLLTKLIPCTKCKIHYFYYLKKKPIKNYLISKNKLLRWVNDLHNSVNKKLRKKIFEYPESLKKYTDEKQNIKIHEKLCILLDYHIKTMDSHKFILIKKLFLLLFEIFPCNICKKKLIEYNKHNNINNTNKNSIKKWYKELNICRIIKNRNN